MSAIQPRARNSIDEVLSIIKFAPIGLLSLFCFAPVDLQIEELGINVNQIWFIWGTCSLFIVFVIFVPYEELNYIEAIVINAIPVEIVFLFVVAQHRFLLTVVLIGCVGAAVIVFRFLTYNALKKGAGRYDSKLLRRIQKNRGKISLLMVSAVLWIMVVGMSWINIIESNTEKSSNSAKKIGEEIGNEFDLNPIGVYVSYNNDQGG